MNDNGGTRIAVIEMGRPRGKVKSSHGSFGNWFCEAFRQAAPMAEVFLLPVEATALDMREASGIVLSGAYEGVYDDLPWRSRFDAEMRLVVESGVPVLGVCFGHQYLTELLGGTVEKRPEKEEIGWYELELTDAGRDDELFVGIAHRFGALETHIDMVVEPAAGAIVLARSDEAPVQAFRSGRNVWGVQFHPEMSAGILGSVLEEEILEARAACDGGREALLEGKKDRVGRPHAGLRVLGNFARICSGRFV